MTHLSININKIATLRNARGENVPDLVAFAVACQNLGADGITVHPRPDERHIRRQDVYDLRPKVVKEFNIEGYPSDDFMSLVLQVRPEQVTLVPDSPEQLTSNSGWDVIANSEFLGDIVDRLRDAGIRSSIFVAPIEDQIRAAAAVGADRVELYTKPYADMYESDPDGAVAPYVEASRVAHSVGLGVNAGHDLNSRNLGFFHQRMPYLDEVSIGHALISQALYDGLKATVDDYKRALEE